MNTSERVRGCLFGLAIGDALGAAVEFRPPGTFPLVTDFRDGGPHFLRPGEWTDDTSMALALADSLAERGWDPEDQTLRYCSWWRNGKYSVNGECFDIGTQTAYALGKFSSGTNWKESGPKDDQRSGNGSIMRLAPVPMYYFHLYPNELEKIAEYSELSRMPTHASEQCLSACRYLGVILAGLMAGESRELVLSSEWHGLQKLREIKPLHPLIDEVANGSYRDTAPPYIRGSGHVVKSLEAALWAFHEARDFEEAVLAAVNLGDDADTTGAICGQLAGAFWGESEIPSHLLDNLAKKGMIDNILEKLLSK